MLHVLNRNITKKNEIYASSIVINALLGHVQLHVPSSIGKCCVSVVVLSLIIYVLQESTESKTFITAIPLKCRGTRQLRI